MNFNPLATHTRLIRPSMPIPLKSVFGSSPWKPMSPHCLVILDSSLTVGINSAHNWKKKSGEGYSFSPVQMIKKTKQTNRKKHIKKTFSWGTHIREHGFVVLVIRVKSLFSQVFYRYTQVAVSCYLQEADVQASLEPRIVEDQQLKTMF